MKSKVGKSKRLKALVRKSPDDKSRYEWCVTLDGNIISSGTEIAHSNARAVAWVQLQQAQSSEFPWTEVTEPCEGLGGRPT